MNEETRMWLAYLTGFYESKMGRITEETHPALFEFLQRLEEEDV